MIRDYIALDLETTGLNANSDRILEIGAVKFKDGKPADTFETIVNCQMVIPDLITQITGIDNSMLEGAMETGKAVANLIEFCEELPLLGHNILFDYSFVKRQAANMNLEFEKMGLDTLKIAKYCLPDLPSRRLDSMCCHYQIEQQQHHRALDDALSASRVYDCLVREFSEVFPRAFEPVPLIYKVRKQSPITNSQKVYLIDLVKYHRIELEVSIESLTKNDASRLIDNIISQKGRIKR